MGLARFWTGRPPVCPPPPAQSADRGRAATGRAVVGSCGSAAYGSGSCPSSCASAGGRRGARRRRRFRQGPGTAAAVESQADLGRRQPGVQATRIASGHPLQPAVNRPAAAVSCRRFFLLLLCCSPLPRPFYTHTHTHTHTVGDFFLGRREARPR